MVHQRIVRILSLTLLLALPSTVEAGPPLICVPFETGDAALLPWGQGQGWNTPDGRYDVRRLTRDTLQLLTAEAPVLARMENLRRATIYAAGDRRVADELLGAVLERARSGADANALFDAGYLVESYKQMAHIHRGPAPSIDGYEMVRRAIGQAGSAEMEFAASLMTEGAVSAAHRRRALAAAGHDALLARNLAK